MNLLKGCYPRSASKILRLENLGAQRPKTCTPKTTLPETLVETETTLCSTCRSLLIQPFSDPTVQSIVTEAQQSKAYSSSAAVPSAGLTGCLLCRLVLAVEATLWQHTEHRSSKFLQNDLDSFKIALVWWKDKKRFWKIEVTPLNSQGHDLSQHSYLIPSSLNWQVILPVYCPLLPLI